MGNLLTAVDAPTLLERSRSSLFSLSTGDVSARAAEANTLYGLGKIIFVLEKFGVDSSTTFCLFTPDGAITRNKSRWDAGFGYGCLLHLPDRDHSPPFVFPQLKPNACGVLVAKTKAHLSAQEVYTRLSEARRSLSIRGTPLTLNLGSSNHFIEVCTVATSRVPGLTNGDEVAVIHTSPAEFKNRLYATDVWIEAGGEWVETPLGPIMVLRGPVAEAYLSDYLEIEQFAKERRITIARAIFEDIEVVSNPTHQGLFSQNRLGLGLYDTGDETATTNNAGVFPLTLRWDIPIYLIRGRPNLSARVIDEYGLSQRAEKKGIHDILRCANILPHGGGYSLPLNSQYDVRVVHNGTRRFFHLSSNDEVGNEYVFSFPSELPYDYRGREVLEMIETLELGEPVAELHQRYTIKY